MFFEQIDRMMGRDADLILVMDGGVVSAMGTHEQLMASCPTYQEIARSQLSEAELGGAGA